MDPPKIIGLAEDIVQTLREPLLVLDKRLQIITANPSFYSTFQVSPEETLNKLIFHLGNSQWDIPKLRTLLEEILPKHREFHDFEVDNVFDHLGRRIMLLNAKRVLRRERKQDLILLAIEDITERRRLEEKLEEAAQKITALSLMDELTQLYNRRGFLQSAHQQMKVANRIKQKMCLFFIDLNDLKQINDEYGHREGDQALAAFGKVLRKTFRESDIISRFGGDEFVVLGFETTGMVEETVIARIGKHLDDEYTQATHPYKLSASIGVAYYDPASPSSIDELLTKADKMMYANKQHNKSSPQK